jgi:hypothetical protein
LLHAYTPFGSADLLQVIQCQTLIGIKWLKEAVQPTPDTAKKINELNELTGKNDLEMHHICKPLVSFTINEVPTATWTKLLHLKPQVMIWYYQGHGSHSSINTEAEKIRLA